MDHDAGPGREPDGVGVGLTLRYVVALLAIAALSIIAHAALTSTIDTQEGAAAELNVSGRQRMLTQRIALHAAALPTASPQEAVATRQRLRDLIGLMRWSHEGLVEGDAALGLPGDPSPELEAIYFGDLALDRRVRDYLDAAAGILGVPPADLRAGDERLRRVVATAQADGPDDLLGTLDQAVRAYQEETEREVSSVLEVARIVLVVTLLALLIEGIFVFRPLVGRLRRDAITLSDARARLQSVLDNALVGVLTLGPSGRILDVNETGETLLDASLAELESRDVTDLAATDDGARVLHHLVEESRIDEVSTSTEVELSRGAGTFLAQMSAKRALGPDGELLSVVLTDETDRKLLEERLRHDALHDPLTGLANRALFAERIEVALGRSERRSEAPAVLYIDMDDFKAVNDSLGHRAGDQVLVEAARRISSCLRTHDAAARLGGDEFAVLIEDVTDKDVPGAVAERIRAALSEPFAVDGRELSIAASIGVARAEPGMDPDALMGLADAAMYEVKRTRSGSVSTPAGAGRGRAVGNTG